MELSQYELVRYPSGSINIIKVTPGSSFRDVVGAFTNERDAQRALERLIGIDPDRRDRFARWMLRLVRGEWLPDEGISAEAKRFLPSLLVGVYEADRRGQRVSKRDAASLMNADPASSGPKYIEVAIELGLIEVLHRPPEDRRKDFLMPTQRLRTILDTEIAALERNEEGRQGSVTGKMWSAA